MKNPNQIITDLQDIFLATSWGSESCSGDAFLAVCEEVQESLDSRLFLVLRPSGGMLFPLMLRVGEQQEFDLSPMPVDIMNSYLGSEPAKSFSEESLKKVMETGGFQGELPVFDSVWGIRVAHCNTVFGFIIASSSSPLSLESCALLGSIFLPDLMRVEISVLEQGLRLLETKATILNLLQGVNLNSETQVLVRCFPVISRYFHAQRTSLWLFREETGNLHLIHGEGLEDREISVSPREGLVGQCFGSGRTQFSNDPYSDANFLKGMDDLTGFKTGSILMSPLLYEKRSAGVLQILNKDGGFSFLDVAQVGEVAATLASHLSVKKLLKSH
jgi:hypothetical protein